VVNLGVGIPSGVASVAAEEGMLDRLTFTVEHGIVGGLPAGGVIFGVAYNPEAIIEEDAQFNFFDGGGLDLAILGMAQMDGHGNVNASKVPGMLAGCGGFINISQNAKRVVFCGTLTTKGLRCNVGEGRIEIEQEGAIRKFVDDVTQITFSGHYAQSAAQPVLYVTERAVFELTPDGILLKEIAPGIDLQRDVLEQIDFQAILPDQLVLMDEEIFR
jgi:propionate CoA-transferase